MTKLFLSKQFIFTAMMILILFSGLKPLPAEATSSSKSEITFKLSKKALPNRTHVGTTDIPTSDGNYGIASQPNTGEYIGSVPYTAIPYINSEGVSLNGDTLQIFNYMPVTIQKEETVEPIPGVTAAIIEQMRAENRASGQSAQIVHDPSLDKLANQRVKQWGEIWDQYGSAVAREASISHFEGYFPHSFIQVVFYDSKYNEASEISTIAVDWVSYGATPEQFGETIIQNFNTSDNHSSFYRNLTAEVEEEYQVAFGVAYEKNPSGSYNVTIVAGQVSKNPIIDTTIRK